MARIPDALSIARPVPQGRAPVARMDTQFAGAAMGELAGALGEMGERQSRNQLAKAEADFLITKAEQDNAYEQDDDYSTIPERYEGAMSERLGEIAGNIDDPELRNEFVNKYRVNVAQGTERIKGVAWGKERDFERGSLDDRLNKLRESALQSGDLVMANQAADDLVGSAAELEFVSEQERVAMTTDFKHGLASGRIEMMEPEKRLEALKQPWAKNIPSDTRAKLKREAEKATRAGKAVGIVDSYMSKELDIETGMVEAEKITDPLLRKEVESRFAYDHGMQRKATVEQQSELRDIYFSDVALGKLTVDNIPKDDWEAMGADVQASLISAQGQSARGAKTPFNVVHHDKLMQLKVQADRGVPDAGIKMREYFIANAHGMSETQQKTWSTASIDGLMPLEAESGLSDAQIASAKLPASIDAEARRVLIGEIGEWRENFIERYQKQPTDKDRDDALDRMLMEYATGEFFGIRMGTKPVYEMSEEESREAMVLMREDNPEAFANATDYFKDKGVQPTAAEFMEAFAKLNATQ